VDLISFTISGTFMASTCLEYKDLREGLIEELISFFPPDLFPKEERGGGERDHQSEARETDPRARVV